MNYLAGALGNYGLGAAGDLVPQSQCGSDMVWTPTMTLADGTAVGTCAGALTNPVATPARRPNRPQPTPVSIGATKIAVAAETAAAALSTTNKALAIGMLAGGGLALVFGITRLNRRQAALGLLLSTLGVAGVVGGGYSLIASRGVT